MDTTDSRLSDTRTPKAHTHDDRYYTEAEVNNLLAAVTKNYTVSIVKTEIITVSANSRRDYSFPFSLPSGAKITSQNPTLYDNGFGISVGRNLNKDYTVRIWNNSGVEKNVAVAYYVTYVI